MIPKFSNEEKNLIKKWITAGTIIILFYVVLLNFQTVLSWTKALYKVIEPFIFGYFLSFLLRDVVFWAEEKLFANFKLKRLLATLSVFLVLILSITIVMVVTVPRLFNSSLTLATQLPQVFENISNTIRQWHLPEQLMASLQELLRSFSSFISNALSLQIPNIINSAFSITGGLFTAFMTLIVAVYFLLDMEFYRRGFKKLTIAIFGQRLAQRIFGISHLSGIVYRDFMYSRLASSGLLFVMTFLILDIFKIEYALLFSIALAIANLIPVLGLWIGLIPLAGYLYFVNVWGMWMLLITAVIYVLIDNFTIQPYVQRNNFHLKTFWVVLVIVVIGRYFGLFGILFALPLVSLIYQLGSTFYKLEQNKVDDHA